MFDSRKIDSYFENAKAMSSSRGTDGQISFSWSRFVKLGFPCMAAAIFGVMVVLPNIKKSTDIKDELTLPRKSEMEKLHAEQVVLNATDKKNRVSTVWSDNMDEMESDSDEIKINNPRAEIPSDNGNIKLSAEEGFVNQSTKILRLHNNVNAFDERGNSVTTEAATYEFEKELGYGKKQVFAKGDWGNLEAQGFTYDKNSQVLTLFGSTIIKTENGTLESRKKTEYFQNENKIISIGNAVAKHENYTLKADKIINYLSAGTKKELLKTEAFGNVEIISDKGTAKADRAIYLSKTKNAELFDNVIILTPKGTAKGNHAIYNQADNTVDLYGNVVLEQAENFMHGSHLHTDLNTSVSTLKSDKKQGSRVSGTFYNKRKAENGKKTN